MKYYLKFENTSATHNKPCWAAAYLPNSLNEEEGNLFLLGAFGETFEEAKAEVIKRLKDYKPMEVPPPEAIEI